MEELVKSGQINTIQSELMLHKEDHWTLLDD